MLRDGMMSFNPKGIVYLSQGLFDPRENYPW